ncbi:type II CAAX endopeptidase family protein [Mollicutes bacterium LVI A0039]|nr:type II CAAX endopeptidase family protein [Mollicutes bacterium LVI A0039]
MNQERNPFTQEATIERINHFENNQFQGDPFNAPESVKVNPWLERGKGLLILAGFYGSQILTGILIVILLYASGVDETTFDSLYISYSFIAMAIVDFLIIIVLAAIYWKRIKQGIKQVFSSVGMYFVKIIGYFALFWMATAFFNILDYALFPTLIEEVGENQEMIESALTWNFSLWMVFAICIGAPIIEEYVFRYGFIKKLLYGLNKYVAAIIAAFIFSFMHIGFAQITDISMFVHLMLGYMGQALVFGIVYVREDNLIYPITIHFLGNAQAVLIITLLY